MTQMLQGRFILSELFQLVLGKVADLKALTEPEFALHGHELLADAFDQSGFTGTVYAQHTDPFTGTDGKFHIRENGFIGVAETDFLRLN